MIMLTPLDTPRFASTPTIGIWNDPSMPPIPPSPTLPSPKTAFPLDSATAQARALAKATLNSLNESMHTSTSTQASPLLPLLYSSRLRLSISTVSTTTTDDHLLHNVSTLPDAVAALADVGLLGATFDDPPLCKTDYVPSCISVSVAGVLHLASSDNNKQQQPVRYWRHLTLQWGCNGVSSPRTSSPADWRISEDKIALFP